MALELFKPFVFHRLQDKGYATTIKNAQKLVERETPEVWEVLEEVVKDHPVLLNRAPTLHRAGIQAFEPVLVNGKAIRIHPLVCAAFNADFDGDQMAVHVPLSLEAQVEAKILMMATSNLLSPANGSPLALPSQDMVLGIYYMTKDLGHKDILRYRSAGQDGDSQAMLLTLSAWQPEDGAEGGLVSPTAGIHLRQQDGQVVVHAVSDDGTPGLDALRGAIVTDINRTPIHTLVDCRRATQRPTFASAREVIIAYHDHRIGLLDAIRLRSPIRSADLSAQAGAPRSAAAAQPAPRWKYLDTTVGRVLLNQILPADYPFVNKHLNKKGVTQLIMDIHLRYGNEVTVNVLDQLKSLGFRFSTQSGLSIGLDDMQVPSRKLSLIAQAQEEVAKVYDQYNNGVITNGERNNKVIDIWSKVTEQVADELFRELGEAQELQVGPIDPADLPALEGPDFIRQSSAFNPIYMMADSGARGSRQQIRQLAGMRGLMAKPSGEIIETPITANFREGLSVLQYFISTHGARKGLADTALKTADSGYLTRRLVDVSQDVTVSEHDCETLDGIYVTPIVEGGEVIESLRDRIIGRVALEDIRHPVSGEILVHANELIDETLAEHLENAGVNPYPHPFGLDLSIQTRGLRLVLWQQSGDSQTRQPGRSGRDSRGPIDWRTGHPAHHAHLPYRRHG